METQNNKELERSIARLESENDHLETELGELNALLQAVGFENGLETIKATAIELMEIEAEDSINMY